MTDDVKALLNEVAKRTANGSADPAPVRKRRTKKTETRGISDNTKRLRSNRDKSILTQSGSRLLRFTTGKVIDSTSCPKGITAHGHWLFVDNAENLPDTVANCVCRCTVPSEFPDKEN